MTVRLLAAIAIALFLVGIFLGHVTAHASRSTPAYGFAPVVVPGIREGLGAGDTTLTTVEPSAPGSSNSPSLILDPAPSRSPEPRPAVEVPAPEPATVTPRPVVVAPKAGVRGEASWYDDPRKAGLYAAAGPSLRVGNWRGRTVTVCGATCFAVTLSDWCGCPGHRVIDLSSTAFRRLAPLGIGVTDVTVTW